MLRTRLRDRASSGGGDSWSPTDIPGLKLWLDASDTSTITHSGGSVSQWNDKSGNGYHATQGTGANQPTTNTRTINSRNVIDFDGTNKYFYLPAGLMTFLNTNNFDCFVVAANDSTTAYQHIIGGRDSGVGDVRFGVITDNGAVHAMCNPSYTLSTKTVTRDTNQHVFGATRTGSIINSLYDGGTLGSNATAVNVNMNLLIIGQTGVNTSYFDGGIGEIVICPVQTNSVRNSLMGYFATKWGITWTNF